MNPITPHFLQLAFAQLKSTSVKTKRMLARTDCGSVPAVGSYSRACMWGVLSLGLIGASLGSATLATKAHAAEANIYPVGFGPNPSLPAPDESLLPTVNIAPAVGWKKGAKPVAAEGFKVHAFAAGLNHPRWLYVLPNGDVLVAETNEPAKPDDNQGIKGKVMDLVMKRAGAKAPTANRIMLLRDANGDGIAETRSVFLKNLNSPFGMALIDNTLYVANTDAVVGYPYKPGATQITAAGKKLADLPGGPLNHHWTKNIIASADKTRLYATSGSNSNIGENGMEQEKDRAAILEIDVASGKTRLFASGLRNPNGLAWQPQSGKLWTAVNERDNLGNNLVPDYITSVEDGGFYGWPYSYYGQNVDERVQPQNPSLVSKAKMPDYAVGAHTASLGLVFYDASSFPSKYKHGAFIGQHGSWNRKPASGYKVVFVPFSGGNPAGPPEDILIGFLNDDGEAKGRPVGVAVSKAGDLLVADDVGNAVWLVKHDQAKLSQAAAEITKSANMQ